MARGKKQVSIQYRRAADPTGALGNQSLQQMLSAALSLPHSGEKPATGSVQGRHWATPAYGTLVLNEYTDNPGGFFGELVRFEPGADLTLLEMKEGTRSYNLKQSKPPEGHEPFKGVVYFFCVENDVVVLEQDVSTLRAEQYASWLLTERTGLLPEGARILLEADFGDRLAEVQSVTLRPPTINQLAPLEVAARGSASPTIHGARTLDVLRAAGLDEASIYDLTKESSSIEVTVQLRFKNDRNKQQVKGERIGRLLRNVPDDEIQLDGPAGRERAGKLVRLAFGASVTSHGALLDRQDVARALLEAYTYFLRNGHIQR